MVVDPLERIQRVPVYVVVRFYLCAPILERLEKRSELKRAQADFLKRAKAREALLARLRARRKVLRFPREEFKETMHCLDRGEEFRRSDRLAVREFSENLEAFTHLQPHRLHSVIGPGILGYSVLPWVLHSHDRSALESR